MVEQKEIDNQKLEEVKSEKPVAEVDNKEDVKLLEEKANVEVGKNTEKPIEGTKSGSSGSDDGKPTASDKEDPGNKTAEKKEEKKDDKKKAEKKSTGDVGKGTKVPSGPKRTEAVVNGMNLRISTKQSVAVCNFIRNKNIDIALHELDEVSKMRRPVPMRGEIPHRKGKGMMSGRYPLNTVKEFIMLLKSLKANAINHELELEKVKLDCKANVASRPMKRFGQGKHKRSHVQIKLVPMGKK